MLNSHDPQSRGNCTVPALMRGLRILELLAAADQPYNLSAIARHFGIAVSSAHLICSTLRNEGFIEKRIDRSFQLTRKMHDLANSKYLK